MIDPPTLPSPSLLAGPHWPPAGRDPEAWLNLPDEWGPYDQLTRVAQGGMGTVYRARNRAINRIEAVKILHAGTVASATDLARFRFESEAAAGLDHPNIVPVYGGGLVEGLPYFAMKWVDGGELTYQLGVLQRDPKALAAVAAKVARAVQHAHSHGILHRDLKPANVLVDHDGEPHVTDFGLAKRADQAKGLTVTGSVVGTPNYMAPEQARGDPHLTVAVDIYGLGGILYFLLTGHAPFGGDTVAEVMRRVVVDAPAAPHRVVAAANPDLEAVCLKCLEKSPADRYPSAQAVADDLERFGRGESISVRPPGVWEWFRRELRKTPAPFAGYVWQVKIWFGVLVAAAQAAALAACWLAAPVGVVWGTYLAAWAGMAFALYATMANKFTRLPMTEQHSVMVAVGHALAHVALTFAVLPASGPATAALALYPPMAAITGLAFFVIGTTHWGRFYWYGLGVTLLAPVIALWPFAGTAVYSTATALAMWHWAYAVKVTFGRPGPEGQLPSTRRTPVQTGGLTPTAYLPADLGPLAAPAEGRA